MKNLCRSILYALILISYEMRVFAQDPELENKVKAAYLLNFISYTDWPEGTFSTDKDPLYICLNASESFQETLKEAVSLQKNLSRPLEVSEYKKEQTCHVLYLSNDKKEKYQQIMLPLKSSPVLLVGEDDEFTNQGGMIGLVQHEETVQFQVNLQRAEEVGLKLSSRMLSLAKAVQK